MRDTLQAMPRVSSRVVRIDGVVRIDLLRFLAGCHERRLNQAVSLSWHWLFVCVLLCCLLGPFFESH